MRTSLSCSNQREGSNSAFASLLLSQSWLKRILQDGAMLHVRKEEALQFGKLGEIILFLPKRGAKGHYSAHPVISSAYNMYIAVACGSAAVQVQPRLICKYLRGCFTPPSNAPRPVDLLDLNLQANRNDGNFRRLVWWRAV